MLEALARGEADPKAPDAQFRVLFVKLSEKARAQDIDGAEQIAGQALAIAKAHNWYPMQVVVRSVLGAAHLQLRNFESALYEYRTATDISRAAKAVEDPAGAKMEVQSLFAEGATLVAMGNYEQAAEAYLEAAPLAEALTDPFLTMEAWRMAAYCYEVEKDIANAIQYGERALGAGRELPEDQRAQSTLPYVGDASASVPGSVPRPRARVALQPASIF
jgi:tetratricopeptide (TPR) repeat protein